MCFLVASHWPAAGKDFLSLKPTPGGPLCGWPNRSLLDAGHWLRSPGLACMELAARALEGRREP